MCELLGLAFDQPIHASLSFRGLRNRAKKNPHGWGLAVYSDHAANVFKEPLTGNRSSLSRFVRDYTRLKSRIFIGHVRYGTCGEQTLANTHPFCREFRGRSLVLVHNGTLEVDSLRAELDGSYTPIGETDSELAFCWLLTVMRKKDISLDAYAKFEKLLQRLNQLGTCCLLISDGEHLFAYRDKDGIRKLSYVQRKQPFAKFRLIDEEWKAHVEPKKFLGQKGYVIATNPLTNESWQELEAGTLTVIRNGERVYPAI